MHTLSPTTAIGNRGEDAAQKWLRQNKFEILARNWRSGHYELDIVARKWDTIHFVEVKTRHRGSLTTPQEALTPQKCESLRRAINAYLAIYRSRYEIQIDLIGVTMDDDGSCDVTYHPKAIEYHWR